MGSLQAIEDFNQLSVKEFEDLEEERIACSKE